MQSNEVKNLDKKYFYATDDGTERQIVLSKNISFIEQEQEKIKNPDYKYINTNVPYSIELAQITINELRSSLNPPMTEHNKFVEWNEFHNKYCATEECNFAFEIEKKYLHFAIWGKEKDGIVTELWCEVRGVLTDYNEFYLEIDKFVTSFNKLACKHNLILYKYYSLLCDFSDKKEIMNFLKDSDD